MSARPEAPAVSPLIAARNPPPALAEFFPEAVRRERIVAALVAAPDVGAPRFDALRESST